LQAQKVCMTFWSLVRQRLLLITVANRLGIHGLGRF
jgi:hypothetical protein